MGKIYSWQHPVENAQNKVEVQRIKGCSLLGEFEKLSVLEEEDTAEITQIELCAPNYHLGGNFLQMRLQLRAERKAVFPAVTVPFVQPKPFGAWRRSDVRHTPTQLWSVQIHNIHYILYTSALCAGESVHMGRGEFRTNTQRGLLWGLHRGSANLWVHLRSVLHSWTLPGGICY